MTTQQQADAEYAAERLVEAAILRIAADADDCQAAEVAESNPEWSSYLARRAAHKRYLANS